MRYTMGAIIAGLKVWSCPPERAIFGYSTSFFAHLLVSFSNDCHDRSGDRIAGRTFFSGWCCWSTGSWKRPRSE
ncbi:MAG: hypothetical protein ABC537_03995 [Candidatus Methanosuratincola sp.]